jgi:hypothetical protein
MGYICRHREGFMKHAVEMGSDATINMPSFIKIVSGILKLMEGFTGTETALLSGT